MSHILFNDLEINDWEFTVQKKILSGIILATAAMNAYAIAPGLYLGLMMGPGSNDGKEQPLQVQPLPTSSQPQATTAPANPKSTMFGSRVFIGYKFNEYGAFEGGFSYFSGITFVLKDPNLVPVAGKTMRVRSIDLVGKLDYSYSNIVGFFAKGGVAAVYTTTPGALNITNYNQKTGKNSGSNTYKTKLSPTFSLGATYDLNQNWQTDISWTRLATGGAVNYVNLYAIGLSYHFVDVYCGQFLC